MRFGLRTKYSQIDLQEVSLDDLTLIGGGCGGDGGSLSVQSVQSVQSAAQSAAAAPGASSGASATVSPLAAGNINICFTYCPNGTVRSDCACVDGRTGTVTTSTVTASSSSSSGGFWASVSSFFSWLFGSH